MYHVKYILYYYNIIMINEYELKLNIFFLSISKNLLYRYILLTLYFQFYSQMCVCRVGPSRPGGGGSCGDAVVRRTLIVTGIAICDDGIDTDLICVRYDYRRGS